LPQLTRVNGWQH